MTENQSGVRVDSDLVVMCTSEDLRVQATQMLSEKFTVSAFADATSALAAVRKVRPLAALISADSAGRELLDGIRGDDEIKDIPVMVAAEEGESYLGLLEAGAEDFLTHPLNSFEVLLRVGQLVKMHQLEREYEVLTAKFQRTNHKLEELIVTDTLTSVGNRRAFEGMLPQELARSRRAGKPLSLLMIDIDSFKRYNDRYGHKAGDDCLLEVAEEVLEAAQRPADYVARFGSEEFAVILPDTDGIGGMLVADRIIAGLVERAIPYEASRLASHVTVSIGITEAGPIDRAEELVERSFEALRLAKSQGRNQAVRWTAEARIEDTILEM